MTSNITGISPHRKAKTWTKVRRCGALVKNRLIYPFTFKAEATKRLGSLLGNSDDRTPFVTIRLLWREGINGLRAVNDRVEKIIRNNRELYRWGIPRILERLSSGIIKSSLLFFITHLSLHGVSDYSIALLFGFTIPFASVPIWIGLGLSGNLECDVYRERKGKEKPKWHGFYESTGGGRQRSGNVTGNTWEGLKLERLILGIEHIPQSDITKEVLKAAYRKSAQKYHPDREGEHQTFIALTEAYKRVKTYLNI
jgi:hypothetical protein